MKIMHSYNLWIEYLTLTEDSVNNSTKKNKTERDFFVDRRFFLDEGFFHG